MSKTGSLRILHVEDDKAHAELIRHALADAALACDIQLTMTRGEFVRALEQAAPDLILSDNRGFDFDGLEALRLAHGRYPQVPFLFVSSSFAGKDTDALIAAGASHFVLKSDLDNLATVIRHTLHGRPPAADLAGIERQLKRRTDELRLLDRELEAFSYAISHDLRGPLRSISGFAGLLMKEYGDKLDADGRHYLDYVTGGTKRMAELIEDLIGLSRVAREPMRLGTVSLTDLAQAVMTGIRSRDPTRRCSVDIAEGMTAQGDAHLLTLLLENLLGNAWKFTAKRSDAHIAFGSGLEDGGWVFHVRDDGAGLNMDHVGRLFAPFQRLHGEDEFAGNGIGLAIAQRIVARHHGRIWVEAAEAEGATFFFTLAADGPAAT